MQELTFEQVEEVSGAFQEMNDGRVGPQPFPAPDMPDWLRRLFEQQP